MEKEKEIQKYLFVFFFMVKSKARSNLEGYPSIQTMNED